MRWAGEKRQLWGMRLLRACAIVLGCSSLLKMAHPAPVVAYLASMGYQGGTLMIITAVELLVAALLWLPTTRIMGLFLTSSYLGGAVAAHVALHHAFTGGPFLVFMASHPFFGALEPGVVLVAAWLGAWLLHSEMFLSGVAQAGPVAGRLRTASAGVTLSPTA